jgi:pyruvate/2-oxoglutarate dehydrogenase complex dihydrolipoamide dehydrogenase (E3) component
MPPYEEHLRSLELDPPDEFNKQLADNTHPQNWTNPKPKSIYDAVVIGAGTAGLVAASGISGLGGDVALVEQHLMGGDCLNYGCVPSKAIIASGRTAALQLNTAEFGVPDRSEYPADFEEVMRRMRRLRAQISPHDSVERFSDKGIDVFLGHAQFVDRRTIEICGQRIRFRRAIISTGAHPFVPPIPGIENAPVYTNLTLFNLTTKPNHLLVVGGGPIGVEMSQAFARIGVKVTLVEGSARILPRDDSEAAALVTRSLINDGVDILSSTKLLRLNTSPSGTEAILERSDGQRFIKTDAILMAVGRQPTVNNLGLDAAGVVFDDRKGISIDDFFRTSNHSIFAIGDVAGSFQFTHAAEAMARATIANAFFFGRQRLSRLNVPWTTYTSPEVAGVGMSAETALKKYKDKVQEIQIEFKDVDRAILDGETEGFLKVVYGKKGLILGATIVAPHAGEMIGEIVAAMNRKVRLGSLGQTIHPYPTFSEAFKQAADTYRRTLLTPSVAKILRWLLRRRA